MEKRQFGYKEIAAITMGILITVLASVFVHKINPAISGRAGSAIASIVIVIVASLLGPLTGILTGSVGYYAAFYIVNGSTNTSVAIIMIAMGIIIGHYSEKFQIYSGKFLGVLFADFIVIEIIANIIGFIFVGPLAQFLLYKNELYYLVNIGISYAITNSLCVAVVCIPVLCIISKKYAGKVKEDVIAPDAEGVN